MRAPLSALIGQLGQAVPRVVLDGLDQSSDVLLGELQRFLAFGSLLRRVLQQSTEIVSDRPEPFGTFK